MASTTVRKLVGVGETRMRNGQIEGLCEFDDGSSEWRPPAKVEVEVINDRTGERADVTNIRVGGEQL